MELLCFSITDKYIYVHVCFFFSLKKKKWLDASQFVLETDLYQFLSLFWCGSVLLLENYTNKQTPLHKSLDAYNISDILFLEIPSTSFPSFFIDFIFTKAVYLKPCALARIAADNKGFANLNSLFTLLKMDCCCVHDVLTVFLFSSLHYFNQVPLCCCILARTEYESPKGNCEQKHLVLLRTPNFFFYWLQNKCCLNE